MITYCNRTMQYLKNGAMKLLTFLKVLTVLVELKAQAHHH